MFRKAIYIPLTALLGTAVAAAAQTPPPLEEPALREYLAQVIERNAALAAAGSARQAAAERIAPAGALPDPTVSFGMMSVPITSFDFEREAMTQLPIGIGQAFPFPGKQAARAGIARGDSSVAAAVVDLSEAALAAQAARAFFQLAYAQSARDIWRSRLELAAQAAGTAMALYETGRVPQTDLLRAELRRATLGEEGHQFAAEVEVAVAATDALRGGPDRPVGAPSLAAPDSSTLRAVEALLADTLPGPAGLPVALQAANPALAVSRARVSRARASSRLFAIAARPDFSIGLQNGIRLGGREPFLSLVVGVSVPLWAGRKQSPAARAAALELQAAQQRHEDLRARLEGELRGQMARLDALRQRVAEVTGQVLPLAEAASSSALGTYGVGALDLTAVLDAQDDLFRVQLRLARLVADYGAQRAALSALLGEEWYR